MKTEVNGDFQGDANVIEIGFVDKDCSFWTVLTEAQANRLIERISAEIAECHEIRAVEAAAKKRKKK